MAVTLIAEDGTGLSTANSYLTVAEADVILEKNPYNESWESVLEPDKAKYLITSSNMLDQVCDWAGWRKHSTSGLRFPRYQVTDKDGTILSDTEVPDKVKEATAYLAWYYSSSNRAAEFSDAGIDRVRVDVIEVRFAKSDRKSVIPREVSYILSGIARINTGQRFAKVVRS